MIKIYFEDLYWKGKLLVFTWHFKEEFDKLKKPIEFALDILNGGEHILVSKRQNKYSGGHKYLQSLTLLYPSGIYKIVYVLLIHAKIVDFRCPENAKHFHDSK